MRRAGGVCHQLTSHSSSNLLHELLGQATCIFFFFNWRYNPWWVLAWFMISFHNLLSLHFSLQFLTFIFFKSSTCLSHLSLGLPILYIYIYIYLNLILYLSYFPLLGRSGAVGCSATLQARRSWVQFPMVSLEFFLDIILLAALWPWGRRLSL